MQNTNTLSEYSANQLINYKNTLNSKQLEALKSTDGPMLIVSAAGCGKTQTLVHRVAYMIMHDVRPENILLLTFTNNAAKEMLTRIASLVGTSHFAHCIQGGTFHSFAANIIREYSWYFDISPYYSILDVIDAQDTIEMVKKQLNMKFKKHEIPPKSSLYKIFSLS